MSIELHKELFQSRFESLNRAVVEMTDAMRRWDAVAISEAGDHYIEARDALHKHVMQIIDSLEK